MADPCVCSDKLYVDDTGRLCLVEGAMGLQAILVYTANDTFSKATYPWLARVHVLVVAGGGGGGGTPTHTAVQVAAGAGGGAGGAAEGVVEESAMGAAVTVTVGAGGAGSTGTGANGNTTSFGPHVIATGGVGGEDGTAIGAIFGTATGGAGGAGTTGDVLYQGGDGENGVSRGPETVNITVGGAGGWSVLLPSLEQSMIGGSFSAGLSAHLQNKGHGGYGAASEWSQGGSAHRGEDGSAGLVVVRLYA